MDESNSGVVGAEINVISPVRAWGPDADDVNASPAFSLQAAETDRESPLDPVLAPNIVGTGDDHDDGDQLFEGVGGAAVAGVDVGSRIAAGSLDAGGLNDGNTLSGADGQLHKVGHGVT